MRLVLALALLASACGSSDGDGSDGSVDPDFAIAFAQPSAGASFVRDDLSSEGVLVAAAVPVEVTAGPSVDRVQLLVGDETLGDVTPGEATSVDIPASGTVMLAAIGYDADGNQVSQATVEVTVYEPTFNTCYEYLDLYGVEYTVGPSQPGVNAPVTVTMPINGMAYRYVENAGQRTTWFMDCELARTMARASPILRARGIVEVADIGIYNYRCIGNEGTPPNCPQGISQHAYGTALDIAGFTDTVGTFYSVETDWVIDPAGQTTCTATTSGDKDALLHQTICELKDEGIFNIILTPNYNADHRNHFHCDLTPNESFMRSWFGVDQGEDRH